jgi:hypoxanthine-DNA glycosylase
VQLKTTLAEPMTNGFAPIAGANACVLVLGTLPSRKSLEQQQYYGHPQNAFWRIMDELFGAGPAISYEERKATLIRNGIAVWDVLAASIRPGSMDSSIDAETARPNDIQAFFVSQPALRLVCFNGKAAASLFRRLVAPTLETGSNKLTFHTLPSTSPAHAAMRFEDKLARWRIIQTGTQT